MSHCLAPGCAETTTIKSHIIPQGFGRWIRAQSTGGGNLIITPERTTSRYQNGMFVNDILCAHHDRQLGREVDEPFFDLATEFPRRNKGTGHYYYRVDDIDPALVARWIVSVFWRTSVTNHRDWHHITIGEFENRAGQIAFGADLSTIPELSIEVGRYRQSLNGRPFETDKVVVMPWTKVINGQRLFLMTVGGFRISMKFDRLILRNSLGPLEIVGQPRLFGACFDLEGTIDHRKMMRVVSAADERDEAKGIEH